MLVVGLTGSIATGKSAVAAMFAARGAAVVDADRIAHALQEPGGDCHRRIVEVFGTGILDVSGRIDRRRLAARVFADPAERRRLEDIMHPAIRAACEGEIRAAGSAGRSICVVEAALILEAGRQGRFDKIVVVSATEESQIDRLVRTRGLSEAEARGRVSSQWSSANKAALADFVIDNSGALASTEEQVTRVYAALESAAGGGSPACGEGPTKT